MSHQNGLSNNGTETTGFKESDDDGDGVQKESENVAHARMVSNRRSSTIQDACGIRLPHVRLSESRADRRPERGSAIHELEAKPKIRYKNPVTEKRRRRCERVRAIRRWRRN